jgi:hypothetical protein
MKTTLSAALGSFELRAFLFVLKKNSSLIKKIKTKKKFINSLF